MAPRLRRLTLLFTPSWGVPLRMRNVFDNVRPVSRYFHSLVSRRPRRQTIISAQYATHAGGGRRPTGRADNVTISHSELSELSNHLLHPFTDKRTLATAMVHKSLIRTGTDHKVFAEIQPRVIVRLTADNEKLELLGDRVLGLLVADHLLQNHESLTEGQVAQAMCYMVSRKTVSLLCRTLRIENFLITAYNIRVLRRSSQPGNFFEALLGALYTDGGLAAARHFFTTKVVPLLEVKLHRGGSDDSKRLLQEHLVASGLPGSDLESRLRYVEVSHQQCDGKQSFTQAIHILGKRLSIGTASSRKRADQVAATRLINNLKKRDSTACVLIRLARSANDKVVLHRAQEVRNDEIRSEKSNELTVNPVPL